MDAGVRVACQALPVALPSGISGLMSGASQFYCCLHIAVAALRADGLARTALHSLRHRRRCLAVKYADHLF